MIIDRITEAVEYPQNSDDWIKTTLIGGVMLIFSWLLLPVFLVYGYMLRVLRATMNDDETPPVFDDWSEMLVDGFKGWLVIIPYGLVPVVLWLVFGAVGAMAGRVSGLLAGLIVFVGFLLAAGAGLAVAYVIPAALANFAETGRLGSGFDVGTLQSVLMAREYAVAWLMGAGILIVSSLVAWIPILGQVVAFYALVAAYYLIGDAWGDLQIVEMRESTTSDERPAV